ncbi:MAG: ribosome biogenesis GTP-binding protein YihA/YsxC [Eubacteriales bacterium]|nr:ribosome biogenesis GTP-binding protein YihA/YsxC [Eubacteriales bacterium]
MNLNNVTMDLSAVSKKQYPDTSMPEFAMAGRSNVGKSSLINRVLNRRKFARVSQTPGKTATINFYNIDDKIHLVDLPGYGYAKVSDKERLKWANMIDEYLSEREQLVAVILLVDLRHKPTDDDVTMMNWIKGNGFSPIVIGTKYDKLKPSQREASLELVRATLGLTDADVFIPFSAVTGYGRDEIIEILEEACDYAESTKRD